jgi:hypothetical protein
MFCGAANYSMLIKCIWTSIPGISVGSAVIACRDALPVGLHSPYLFHVCVIQIIMICLKLLKTTGICPQFFLVESKHKCSSMDNLLAALEHCANMSSGSHGVITKCPSHSTY